MLLNVDLNVKFVQNHLFKMLLFHISGILKGVTPKTLTVLCRLAPALSYCVTGA